MSLELLKDVKRFTIHHRPQERLKLRIGLHSGKLADCPQCLCRCSKLSKAVLLIRTVLETQRFDAIGKHYKWTDKTLHAELSCD